MAYTSAKVINACLMHDNTHTPSVQSLSHQSTDFHQPLRQPWWRPLAELAVFVATYIPALLIFIGVFMGLAWAMGLDESIVNLETMDHPSALAGGLGSLILMIPAARLPLGGVAGAHQGFLWSVAGCIRWGLMFPFLVSVLPIYVIFLVLNLVDLTSVASGSTQMHSCSWVSLWFWFHSKLQRRS